MIVDNSVMEDKLVIKLIEANKAYRNGMPIISDEAFDKLEQELKNINSNHPYFKKIMDDTFYGQEEPLTLFMGSQTKALDLKGLEVLYRRIPNSDIILNNLHISEKIDGASVELTYEQGILVKILTRGNGIRGVNVTDILRNVPSIPKYLEDYSFDIVIRGEIYMTKSSLKLINEKLIKSNKSPFKNTRNGTVAIMKTQENKSLAKYLSFKAFDISINNDILNQDNSLYNKFYFLNHKLHFDVPPYKLIRKGDIPEYYKHKKKEMEHLDYDIDGLVISVNNLLILKNLGLMDDGKCLKGQMALKFESTLEIVTIKNIEWSYEGGQYICPIAIFDPIDLDGAEISRAQLKSPQWMEDNKVGIGTVVSIKRSGGVIPCIVDVLVTNVDKVILPSICEYCSTYIERDGARIYCPNEDCRAKEAFRINHFLSVLNIKGLAFKTILEYVNSGIRLSNFLDEDYTFIDHTVNDNDNISKVIWKKIRKQLENINSLKLSESLSALSITCAGGTTTWNTIINEGYDTVDKIRIMTPRQISECGRNSNKRIGAIRGLKIHNSINSSRVQELLDKLGILLKGRKEKEMFKETEDIIIIPNNKCDLVKPLTGKRIVMTGTGPWQREILRKILEDNGNEVQSSVNKLTNILICEDPTSDSNKMKKALSLGVDVMKYSDIFKEIENE